MPAAGRSYAAVARGLLVFARALGLTGTPWEVAGPRLDVHLKRLDIDRDTHFPHRTRPALCHPRQRADFLEIPQPSQRIGPVLRLERRPEDDNIGVNFIIPIDATSTKRAGGSPVRPRLNRFRGWTGEQSPMVPRLDRGRQAREHHFTSAFAISWSRNLRRSFTNRR